MKRRNDSLHLSFRALVSNVPAAWTYWHPAC